MTYPKGFRAEFSVIVAARGNSKQRRTMVRLWKRTYSVRKASPHLISMYILSPKGE
jgi:hypothetical protein